MDMDPIVEYYNHFNENKRLLSRHGQVEFLTALEFIKKLSVNLKYEGEPAGEAGSKCAGESAGEAGSRRAGESAGEAGSRRAGESAGEAGSRRAGKSVGETGLNSVGKKLRVADIGAGTGRYSYALAREGFDVTAVEYVEHNLDVLRSQKNRVPITSYQGDARDLYMLENDSFDITLLFGPMYHLFSDEDKVKALKEALRITRPGGLVFTAYVMNEYSVIIYGFREKNIKACMENGMLDENFHTLTDPKDLYSYMRLEDIERINRLAVESGEKFQRELIFAADGPANYIRKELKAMDEEEFELFMKYHFATCMRPDLMGASAHTVDVLRKLS